VLSCCATFTDGSNVQQQVFALVKEAEYEVFLQVISSWEREHLLLNV